MPMMGVGVWRMEDKSMKEVILHAIRIGYRHFDCAAKYRNEGEVGEALAEAIRSGLLWNSDHGHVLEACKDSLNKLKLDYLDLYLIHFPIATRHTGTTSSALDDDGVLDMDTTVSLKSTWRAMEDLVSTGFNYGTSLTRDCLAYSRVKPAVNQIEVHPYFQRDALIRFCRKHSIVVTAHSPIGGGLANVELFSSISCLDDSLIQRLAEKYRRTAAQIILRWGIQRNTVIIPKTSKPERFLENFQVFEFELSQEDMDLIKGIDRKHRTNQPAKFWGIDPYE
ncbi:NADP-dependent D-sorbitol-6-phosphate dehydrogenase [Acorus calamus]|uniref:NADP-dependent D-sorbitol-6-phosphate dehydrogenase n=1 Tax=Acorus calamus TaxID=4465 RepID=A0AAV9D8S4_ACOCL|nr:NADP-dependent D-sorbitol-6-phosphate dehydrogenase [Acorus calamus]